MKMTIEEKNSIWKNLGYGYETIPYHRLSIDELIVVFEHEEERPLRVLPNGEIVPSNMDCTEILKKIPVAASKKPKISVKQLQKILEKEPGKIVVKKDGSLSVRHKRKPRK